MKEKKEILIKILEKLKGIRNLAEGFLILLKSKYCDDQTVEELSSMIYRASKDMKESKEKDILQQGLAIIEKIHKKELKEKNKDVEDLDIMLNNL